MVREPIHNSLESWLRTDFTTKITLGITRLLTMPYLNPVYSGSNAISILAGLK